METYELVGDYLDKLAYLPLFCTLLFVLVKSEKKKKSLSIVILVLWTVLFTLQTGYYSHLYIGYSVFKLPDEVFLYIAVFFGWFEYFSSKGYLDPKSL